MTEPTNAIKARGKVKFEDFWKIPVNSVRATGIDLSSSHGSTSRTFTILYYRCWFLSGIWLMISFTAHLILNGSDAFQVTQILPNVLTGYFNLYKGYLMYKNQDDVRKVLDGLKELFPIYAVDQDERKIPTTLKKLLRMKRIYLTLYLSLVTFVFIPPITTFFLTGVRELRSDLWIPFELDNNFKFFAFIIWLFWMMVSFLFCGFGTDFILFTSVTLLSMEFDALKKQLREKINEKGDMKKLIERHNELIQLSNDLQRIFNDFLLLYLSQSSLVVSLMSFALATSNEVLFLPYLIVSLNQTFLLCYFGQKLYDSSSSIYNGVLESNWYEIKEIKSKKILIFLTQRSQRPKVLNADGFATITLNSFMGIITTAYSYYTLMNRLYTESKQ